MELAWQRLEGRDGHRVGLELLRQLMGGTLPEIRRTGRGKPYFPDNPVQFSVSHTKNHVFCAVSEKNIGIDAEEMERTLKTAPLCSPGELARVATPKDLLRLWVLKEAYAKLTGRGIGTYLKNTDFDPKDQRILEIDGCFVAVLEE